MNTTVTELEQVLQKVDALRPEKRDVVARYLARTHA